MATARERMLADARAFFDSEDGPAVDEVVDGVSLRAIVQGLEPDPESMDRVYLEKYRIWMYPGDLTPFPRLGAVVEFRGHFFDVTYSQCQDFSDRLTLTRYTS